MKIKEMKINKNNSIKLKFVQNVKLIFYKI